LLCESKGKRIIVFAISGALHLKTKLTINADRTIAGHIAPGDGIYLKSLPAPVDSDKNGTPGEWEKMKGLNPNDASDTSGYKSDKIYTNIEVYINSLAPPFSEEEVKYKL
jgi:hypothetical protein